MWTTFLLCFLVALSAAEQHNGAWRQNVEYHYKVRTQTLAAIPNLMNEWVGVFTKADLTVRPISKDVLLAKLDNGRYSEWHDALEEDPASRQPEDDRRYEPMDVHSKPFEIRMKNGAIHSIAVDKDMTNVQLNQLKSIISQLQLDMEARNLIEKPRNYLDRNDEDDDKRQDSYQVMEPSVTGKCETQYDIVRVPLYLAQAYDEFDSRMPLEKDEQVYEVTKTKNFERCEQRIGYHFGVSGLNDWKPNTNRMGSLSKSSVSRVVITGSTDKYTIRSAITTNRVVKASPLRTDDDSEQDSMVVSHVNVTLASMQETDNKPHVNTANLVDVGNLVYTYDLPLDTKNAIRPKTDSSEEESDENDSSSQSDEDDDNQLWKYRSDERKGEKKRSRRSTDNSITKNKNNDDSKEENALRKDRDDKRHGSLKRSEDKPKKSDDDSDDDSEEDERRIKRRSEERRRYSRKHRNRRDSDEDSDSDEDDDSHKSKKFQPKPSLKNAPEHPMHPYFIGNKGRSIQHQKDFNSADEVQKLTEEIAQDLEEPEKVSEKNTLRKYHILAQILSTMNAEQIKDTTRAIEDKIKRSNDKMAKRTSEKSRKVYRDALSIAGTGPSTNEIMKWIEEEKVQGEEAVQMAIGFVKNIREPTDEMQKRFFDLLKSEAVQKQTNVKTTIGLALARFLNQAKVDKDSAKNYYPTVYGRWWDRDSDFVSSKVLPYYAAELKKAIKDKDAPKALYAIRAIGNLGHSQAAEVFEPYMSGKERATDFQRLAIVLALDKYADNHPKTAQTVLYKIYQNKGETNEVRAAAVFQLMRVNPKSALLQSMAESTNTEDNEHVKAAVRSALESAARMETPEKVELAENAKSALRLLSSDKQAIQYSRTQLRDYALREMDVSYDQQLSYLVNRDSFLPSALLAETTSSIGGFKRKSEIQAVVSSIEELVNSMDEEKKSSKKSNRNDNDDDDDDKDASSSKHESFKWSAKKIAKLLNMKPTEAKELEGQLMVNIMNSERFLAFDRETLKEMPESVKKLGEQLRSGYDVEFKKFYNQDELTMSFPLESGIPFTFTARTSALVQLQGNVRARTLPNHDNSQKKSHDSNTVNMTADIESVYAGLTEVTVSFTNPHTQQRYTAGYDKKFQLNLPMRISSDIDMRSREIKTEFKPLYEDKEVKLLQMGSYPFTSRDDAFNLRPLHESKHTKDAHKRPLRETNYSVGEKHTGFDIVIRGTQEKGSNQLDKVFRKLSEHDFTSSMVFGQQATDPEHYSLSVSLDGKRSTSKSVKFTLKYDSDADIDNNKKSDEKTHPRSRGQSVNGKDNMAVPDSTKPNSKERREQLMRNAAEDMQESDGANVVDISVEFVGSKKREYVATISSASSKSEGKARVLMYAKKSSSDDEEKAIHAQIDAKYQTAEDERQSSERSDRKGEPHAEIRFKLGYSIEKAVELEIVRGKIEMKQSQQLKEHLKEQARREPKRASERANAVDRLDFELELPIKTVEKELQASKSRLLNYMEYAMSYGTEEKYQGEKDMIKIEVRLSPDMKYANMTMKTPNTKNEYTDLEMPRYTKTMAAIATNYLEKAKRVAIDDRDTCHITANKVNTFEDSTVKHDYLGRTWHLAVHKTRDSSEDGSRSDKKQSHYISVLVRDAEDNKRSDRRNDEESHESRRRDYEQEKEVLIVLHQKTKDDITLRLSPAKSSDNTPRLYVDEKEEKLSSKSTNEIRSKEDSDEILARITVTKRKDSSEERNKQYDEDDDDKKMIRVETELGQLEIRYDGKHVQIRSKSIYRKNRGICGSFTGQQANDLKSPDNKVMLDDNEFITSWAVIEDPNTNRQLKMKQERIKEASYPKEEILRSNPFPKRNKDDDDKKQRNSDDEKSGRSSKNSRGTKHQTQFVEQKEKSRICFSKRPLPTCESGHKANGKTHLTVPVHCRDINDPAAQQYKSSIQRGRHLDLSSHKANDEIKFLVPKRCERA